LEEKVKQENTDQNKDLLYNLDENGVYKLIIQELVIRIYSYISDFKNDLKSINNSKESE